MSDLRIGKVTKVNGGRVKVHFEDVNIESDWLACVNGVQSVGTVVLCAFASGFNGEGYVLGALV